MERGTDNPNGHAGRDDKGLNGPSQRGPEDSDGGTEAGPVTPYCPVDRLFQYEFDSAIEMWVGEALGDTSSDHYLTFNVFNVAISHENNTVTVEDVLDADIECTTSLTDFVARARLAGFGL